MKVHLYVGDGKGKTTAAAGLACRAAGAGFKVAFLQFFKDGSSSEIAQFQKLGIETRFFGTGEFVMREPDEETIGLFNKGISIAEAMLESGKYKLIVLDEVLHGISLGIIEPLELMKLFEGEAELLLTGRQAPEELVQAADYVTEMKKIKHPYDRGLAARKGVEF